MLAHLKKTFSKVNINSDLTNLEVSCRVSTIENQFDNKTCQNASNLLLQSVRERLNAVWPDLAKFRHFGKHLK